MALRNKKIERAKAMADEARAKLGAGDSLSKISSFAPAVSVQQIPDFTFGGAIPGIGRDPFFFGAVSGLKPGQISPAVQNLRGAFVTQLLSVSAFDSTAYTTQREALKTRLLQEKRNRFLSDWLTALKEKADIVDHRDMFFR
jgi:hypothetical protein